jgi:hypothetical protein
MIGLAIRLLVLAVVAYLLYLAFRPGWDFTIVVNNRKDRVRGRFPEAHRSRLASFLRDEVDLERTVTISGRKTPNGFLQLRFRGPVDQPTRQRIRNFLVNLV